MSVYLKGMEMPTSCCECFAFKSNADGYLFCKAKRIAFGKEDAEWLPLKTPNWCPLVPVPEHGDLIDKSGVEVLSWTDGEYGTAFEDGVLFVLDKLDELPVIIPADGEDYEVPADKEGEG